MPTFYYSLSKKSNKDGESEIKLRIYISNEHIIRVGSGVWVEKCRWTKKNTIQVPYIEGEEKNTLKAKKQLLDDLIMGLDIVIFDCKDKNKINKSWLEGFITSFHFERKRQNAKKFASTKTGVSTRNTLLLSLMEDYSLVQKLTRTELGHFNALYKSLKRYELYQRTTGKKLYRLYLNRLTNSDLEEIKDFLKKEKEICIKYPKIYKQVPYYARATNKPADGTFKEININPRERGLNYVETLMAVFRRFVTWAIKEKNIEDNPFDEFIIEERVYGTPIYLTIEERNKLYDLDLSVTPALETQRDIFIFQCLVGCRVGDLGKFTKSSIIDDQLVYIASKTKNQEPKTIQVPLSQKAKAILAKYKDYEGESLFPFVEHYKYNSAIKKAFKLAELDRRTPILDPRTREIAYKPLYKIASSHMARRTFIGNMYKKVKDPNLVSAFSGHKDGSKAFARYREIDLDIKIELIESIDK